MCENNDSEKCDRVMCFSDVMRGNIEKGSEMRSDMFAKTGAWKRSMEDAI